MFTGLVEEKGVLAGRVGQRRGARLSIRCPLAPLVLGESIAVDGACLTVDAITSDGFDADASAETLARTNLGDLAVGSMVNLERAMPLGGRMGGHIVTGHVDGVGSVVARVSEGRTLRLSIAFPDPMGPYLAEKGSVAINGVSLTVNSVRGNRFDVVLIPHTRGATSLDALSVGARVNLEADVIARYIARQLAFMTNGAKPDGPHLTSLAPMAAPGPSITYSAPYSAPSPAPSPAPSSAPSSPDGEIAWLERLSRNGFM